MNHLPDASLVIKLKPGEKEMAINMLGSLDVELREGYVSLDELKNSFSLLPVDSSSTIEFYANDITFATYNIFPSYGALGRIIANNNILCISEEGCSSQYSALKSLISKNEKEKSSILEWEEYRISVLKKAYLPQAIIAKELI